MGGEGGGNKTLNLQPKRHHPSVIPFPNRATQASCARICPHERGCEGDFLGAVVLDHEVLETWEVAKSKCERWFESRLRGSHKSRGASAEN